MTTTELIGKQITLGNELMTSIRLMRERPNNIINVVSFENEDVQNNRKKLNSWQLLTRDVLIRVFGDGDQHVQDFNATITSKDSGFNYQREFEEELNNGLGVLEAVQGLFEIGLSAKECQLAFSQKKPKIFISHKTEEKVFVEELVSLIEFIIGPDKERIFCSSVGGYDIRPGKEILSELKRQFIEYEVLFIVVHSKQYYNSPICLNEMGAAWVLGNDFISFLTADCKYSMLKGAIDSKYMSIKVNDSQDTVISKLNSFKDFLLEKFSIEKGSFNVTRWENKRNEFIARTCKLETADRKESIEDEERKVPEPSADITAELISSRNPCVVSICNRGKVMARNLRVELDKVCEGMLISGLENFPMDYLKPDRHVILHIYPCIGDPKKFKIFFKWEEKGQEFSSEDMIIIY